MNDDLMFNDIYMSKKYITEHKLLPRTGRISIIGNSPLSVPLYKTFEYINKTAENKYILSKTDNPLEFSPTPDTTYIYFLNMDREINTVSLKKVLQGSCKHESSCFLIVTELTKVPFLDFPQNISEIELSVIMENSFLTDIDNELKEFSDKISICQLRINTLYGNNIQNDGYTGIRSICEKVNSEKRITVYQDDAYKEFSAVSVPDAINAIFTVIRKGRNFNTYNAKSFSFTQEYIKTYLFNLTNDYGVQLEYAPPLTSITKKHYSCLSCGKLESLGYSPVTDRDSSLRYAFMSHLDERFDILQKYVNDQYDGKLEYIKKIELYALSEIDSICREYGIRYFLSGGSMLGAVRHRGMIPWDDDIDIAMLREDFEVFKKKSKGMFSENFKYQSFTNRDGYHFFFDKLTNKNTYFATRYSDEFEMLKGISLDIFVFDKTADTPFRQKAHYKRLMLLRRIMNVRWKNRARKDKMYFLSKILLPFIRIFSMDTYSKMYDKATRAYEHKNTQFVLPPATDEKYVGSMPLKWFDKVIPVRFENIDTFIPAGYDGYLKLWYGKNYMDILPICERESSHDFYRLDLGTDLNKRSKLEFEESGELLKGE